MRNYVYGDYEYIGRDECIVGYCSMDAVYSTAFGGMCGYHAAISIKGDEKNA